MFLPKVYIDGREQALLVLKTGISLNYESIENTKSFCSVFLAEIQNKFTSEKIEIRDVSRSKQLTFWVRKFSRWRGTQSFDQILG